MTYLSRENGSFYVGATPGFDWNNTVIERIAGAWIGGTITPRIDISDYVINYHKSCCSTDYLFIDEYFYKELPDKVRIRGEMLVAIHIIFKGG